MSDENNMGVQILEFGFHKINKIKVVGDFKLLRFIKKSKIFSKKTELNICFDPEYSGSTLSPLGSVINDNQIVIE